MTKRTEASTINTLMNRLNKYTNIEGYKYNCFYRVLCETLSDNADVRRIWQNAVIQYMIEDSGSIEAFYDKVNQEVRHLPFRRDYKLGKDARKKYKDHLDKAFPTTSNDKNNDLENSIKFNLMEKEAEPFGKFVAYELPLWQAKSTGKIDCIAYNEQTKELRLIEIKRFGLGTLQENKEPLLRALTEIVTYRACIENILSDATAKKDLQLQLTKAGINVNFDNVKIINCIFAPQNTYKQVDDRIKKFVHSVKNEKYKAELYSITPHKDIAQKKISDDIALDIVSVSL